MVRLRSISQPPPPQVLALGLGHQLGRRTACLAPPAPVEGSSHPKAMPSRRTSLLASEVSKAAASLKCCLLSLIEKCGTLGIRGGLIQVIMWGFSVCVFVVFFV